MKYLPFTIIPTLLLCALPFTSFAQDATIQSTTDQTEVNSYEEVSPSPTETDSPANYDMLAPTSSTDTCQNYSNQNLTSHDSDPQVITSNLNNEETSCDNMQEPQGQGQEQEQEYSSVTVVSYMPRSVIDYGPPPSFESLDTNGDGRITEDESRAFLPLTNDFLNASKGRSSITSAQYQTWVNAY